jgi:hypothetical protein
MGAVCTRAVRGWEGMGTTFRLTALKRRDQLSKIQIYDDIKTDC